MKKFEKAELEVVHFEDTDVVVASCPGDACPLDCPDDCIAVCMDKCYVV